MKEKKTISEELESMEVGDVKSFPAVKLYTVKVTASNKGFILGRVYRCRINRETRTVDVTRKE